MTPATRRKGRLDAGDHCGEVGQSTTSDVKVRIDWTVLHPDLLAEILRRLDVVDYTRCLSVCASWRSIPERSMNFCKPNKDFQLPWLMPFYLRDDPCSRRFHVPSRAHSKMAQYTLHLPQIARQRCIGSSHGFLITRCSHAKCGALNPLTGARFPLPPTATHPDIFLCDEGRPSTPPRLIKPDAYTVVCPTYQKAVISPSLDAIAVLVDGFARHGGMRGHFVNLAFARVGDDSWTALEAPSALEPPSSPTCHYSATDFIFHKGRIYVLYCHGYLVAFSLEIPAAPPLVSPKMLELASASCAFLTETPYGQDLLLLLVSSTIPNMGVFRLDKNTLEWNRVPSIGDVALFVDETYLSSSSTIQYPRLKSNCVYFTTALGRINKQRGVYDLEDGSIHPLAPNDELPELYLFGPADKPWEFRPSLVWFTPAL